jgi:bifunctional DNA-binding transcriptional regulator/antitoxin component of YhaV-PrlF toxin-antitoxin module
MEGVLRVSKGGQISLPAAIRRRWGVGRLLLVDLGDRVELRPLPDDPIGELRGMLRHLDAPPTEVLRAECREEEAIAEERRFGR